MRVASLFPGLLLACAATAAENPLWNELPALCKARLAEDWQPPARFSTGEASPAESGVPGLMYLCTIEKPLPSHERHRRPNLALMLMGIAQKSVVVSAYVWCDADRSETLAALERETARVLDQAKLKPPAALGDAIRAARAYQTRLDGIAIKVAPQEIDRDACAKSSDALLSPVLMEVEVAIDPM